MNLAELIQKKLGLKPEEAEAKAQEWAENEEIAKALNEMQDAADEETAKANLEQISAIGKGSNEPKDPKKDEGQGKEPKDEGQGEPEDPKADEGNNKDKGGKDPEPKGDEGQDPEPAQTGNSDEKIKELEKTIAELQAQNKALVIDNDLKLNLINSGASLEDVDYLIFKIKKDGEIATDKDGKIKDIDKIIEGSKKAHPKLFSGSNDEEIDPKKLQKDDGEGDAITQDDFNKMGYKERVKLANENPELYKKLAGK